MSWSSSRDASSKKPRQDGLSEVEAATVFDQLMEGFGLRRKRRSKDVWYHYFNLSAQMMQKKFPCSIDYDVHNTSIFLS